MDAARGTVKFEGDATVAGRVGGVLTTGAGASRVFKTRFTGLINRVEIAGANRTVTFNSGVGANTLHFTADGIAALNGPATGSDDIFHQMAVTTATSGQGTLRFGNRRAANFLGNIGTASQALKSVTLAAGRTGEVRILGNIYAGEIALNDRHLTLGNGADARGNPIRVFGPAKIATTDITYSINAPIKTTASSDGRGDLNMRDFKFTFEKVLGASGAALANIRINNAMVNMKENVHANRIRLINATATLAKDLYTGTVNLGDNANLTVSGNLTLNNNATLALGVNTLQVTGNVNLAAINSLSITLDATNRNRLALSAGRIMTAAPNAALAIQVAVVDASQIEDEQQFTVVSSKGTLPANLRLQVTGTEDFDFTATRSANGRQLILTASRKAAFTEPTQSTPFAGLGTLVDGLLKDQNTSASMKEVLRAIRRAAGKQPAAQAAAMEELAPRAVAVERASRLVMNNALNTVAARLASRRFASSGSSGSSGSSAPLHLASLGARLAGQQFITSGDEVAGATALWAKVLAGNSQQRRRGGVDGYEADLVGLAIGTDRAISERLRLGMAFSHTRGDINSTGGSQGDDTDLESWQGLAYGTYAKKAGFVDAALALGYTRYDSVRAIDIGAVQRRATADYDGYQAGLRLLGGHERRLNNRLTLTPQAEAEYHFVHRNSYTESGAGALNLRVEGRDHHAVTTGLGAALRAEVEHNGVMVIPQARALWRHDWGTRRSKTVASFATESGRFSTRTRAPGADALHLGVGLNIVSERGWSVSACYDGELRSGQRSHGGSLTLRWVF